MKNIEELTKTDFQEIQSTEDLAEIIGLEIVETTTGTNGYPSNTGYAMIADDIQDLLDLRDKLNDLDIEFYELDLFKKDGWHFWNRSLANGLKIGYFKRYISDQDWYMYINFDEMSEERIKEDLFDYIIGGINNLESFEEIEKSVKLINDRFEEIEHLEGNQRVFFDANNNFSIDYIISDNSTGYNYDTKHYSVGIEIVFPEAD